MRRLCHSIVMIIVIAGPALAGQVGDVNKILADARAALGGEKKLAALRTFAATGQSTRVVGETSSAPTDVELAFELPDKYMRKDVVAVMGTNTITRTSGFNGESVINIVDQPPAMPGMVMIFRSGPGGAAPGATLTPEQEQENRKRQLLSSRQDLARLMLGVVLSPPASYPLAFAYAGQAESPDGKADMVDVTGDGGFAARLFIDTKTHLPLMLSWMAKEPLVVSRTFSRGGPGATPAPAGGGGGGGMVVQSQAGGRSGQAATPEEREKLMKQAEEQSKEAEAKLRVVEYRLYYGDYQDADGIKVPRRLQRSIDGKPVDETTFEKIKVNGKIDPKKFEPGK